MDRLLPPGYFSRPVKISRGPWFKEWMAEDDGLEYYYQFKDSDGNQRYLLSNNVPLKDRNALERLYAGFRRNYMISTFAGFWAGAEIVSRVGYFRKLAPGYRFLAFLGLGYWATEEFRYWGAGYYYMPLLCAFFNKYENKSKTDLFDIRDEKREWFEIDTTQYMSYSFDDLDHHHHNANHGPQPDGEVLDSSWFVELDKFLRGEPNKLKEHPKYRDYNFDYSDKYQWPSTDVVHSVFYAKEKAQHTPDSLKPDAIKVKKDE